MQIITASQIRAARAMLDWSQEDLAKASGLSSATVYNLEKGNISPRGATNNTICQTFENAGLQFSDNEGIKRRICEIITHRGPHSCEMFVDDVLHTIRDKGGEILASVNCQETLIQLCGDDAERLEKLSEIAPIKCLLSESPLLSYFTLPVQFRVMPKQNANPVPYFLYGGKYVFALPEGGLGFKFFLFDDVSLALSWRNHFSTLWDNAVPLLVQMEPQKRAAKG